jgi:hypothetical protein
MSGTEPTKPAGKSGVRKAKGEPRRKKAEQPQTAAPDPLPSQESSQQPDQQPELIEAMAEPPESAPIEDTAPIEEAAPAEEAPPLGEAPPPDPAPISLQVIANAYGDYTRKSLEQTRSFFESLTGARSLDKAVQVQSEFARNAYETFVAESRRIRELHRELARQSLKPLEGLAGKPGRDER